MENDIVRGDPHEGIALWLQKEGLKIEFNVRNFCNFSVTEKTGLIEPVSVFFEGNGNLSIFCISAIKLRNYEVQGDLEEKGKLLKKLNEEMKLDSRCLTEFGKYAVVVDKSKFLFRIRERLLESRHEFSYDLVDYYDDEVFNGEIPLRKVVFSKQKRYGWQSEFRICINTNTKGKEAKIFEIGDMSDFSKIVDSSTVNDIFRIFENNVEN